MKKHSPPKAAQIIGALIALAALFCAVIGMLDYLADLTRRKKPYTEFPPEYDDIADWGVD